MELFQDDRFTAKSKAKGKGKGMEGVWHWQVQGLLCEGNGVLGFRRDCRAFDGNSRLVEYGNGEKVDLMDLKEKTKFYRKLIGSYGGEGRVWVNG
jgi:hypothetical protein